ncbi:murein biosynthesis integral membrane protein MurJ [Tenacibaculum finnmarkense]|uniref:murein biosynthesis integral membrane protein MurJ n=1 Tax=Tenacibaculum finnmarkense TaxID=2781243 RepID=UPI001EFA3E14|nr:murein biosynthesis integral membrane protein MurJ [Tenacibaculum finnmarkense]MCG8219888.1 murein biosynthesis integral membrane protein MurJ [Tenacibaculum finnmarkense genomovar finnmarkense]MCG8222540.1 murein biosynthesis integral membrane protein MurJ [Tenacibaculum finnmarkense genomovar finnmarkense]MCG8228073.1 murein biosynthesis integral membrane protein MurJ [Tenacibaculum finnmarkense genomovar finnmarkense]MCG8233470.1 murein biosynthesis integral membrane protein MurJ [Tenacib
MSEKIIKNSIIVLVLIALGKGLSFFRDIIVSYYFGATGNTDAYFAANSVPSLLFTALISSYLVLLIPTYKNIQVKSGVEAANKFGSGLINFILLASILLSAIGFFSMEYLIKLVAPGFDDKTHELALNLGKILVLSFPFSSVTTILANISNANKKYYATQIIPIFSSLFLIIGLYFFAPTYGIYTLATVGVVAFIFQLIIQIIISKKHFHYKVKTAFFDKHIKKMTILALPILLGYSIDQINLLVNSIICSGLPEGNLSALSYAQRLQFTLIGTISTAIITVVYPIMSELVARNDTKKIIILINKSIRAIILIMLPVAIFFAINSKLVIRVIFNRGSFDDAAVNLTSSVFFFYAINVLILSVREFLLRIFYVYNNTKQPLISSGVSIILNVVLSFVFVRFLGVQGLSLANLLATIVSIIVLILFLIQKDFIQIKLSVLGEFVLKLILPIMVFVLMQFGIYNYINITNKYILLLVVFFPSIVLYVIMLFVVKQKEAIFLLDKLKNKLT